jgi:hypothetical protein
MSKRESKIRLSLTVDTVDEIFSAFIVTLGRLGDLEKSAAARGDHSAVEKYARASAVKIKAKAELEFVLGESGLKRIGRA